MILHRAVAYQCQAEHTPATLQQPEVAVFFEVGIHQPARDFLA